MMGEQEGAAQVSELRLSGVIAQSIVDGPGIRFVVFTQGCPHRCPGCHNPETHDFAGGYAALVPALLRAYDKNPLLKGITLSGGEPLAQAQALIPLLEGIRRREGDVFCYSGYTFEEIQARAKEDPAWEHFLSLVDVLIDGPYIEAQRDLTLRFRGSANQRILDVARSLVAGGPVEAVLPD